MLCFEGIAMNLNVFLERQDMPQFSLKAPSSEKLESITVKEEVNEANWHNRGDLLILCRRHKYDHMCLQRF